MVYHRNDSLNHMHQHYHFACPEIWATGCLKNLHVLRCMVVFFPTAPPRSDNTKINETLFHVKGLNKSWTYSIFINSLQRSLSRCFRKSSLSVLGPFQWPKGALEMSRNRCSSLAFYTLYWYRKVSTKYFLLIPALVKLT